jgi:hypothetical protein
MKYLILVSFLMIFGLSQAQTVVFSEDFESLPLGVTSSGSSNWARSTQFSVSGNYCDTAKITASNDTTILTTNTFSTASNSHVMLKFKHIAKLALFDGGYIEVSSNNGSTWTRLSSADYFGEGYFGTTGANVFNSASYPSVWNPINNTLVPQDSWWRSEIFDLSAHIANVSQAKIRFVLTGSNTQNYGWLIDDITVTASTTELLPPSISMMIPYPQDTMLYTGPFDVKASIFDSSGVASAFIVYTISNVADTVQMVSIGGNTYKGAIPSQSYGTTICYQVFAIDSSSNNNKGVNPINTCISFTTKKNPGAPAAFPYDVAMHSVNDPASVVIANTLSPVKVRIENKGDSVLTKAQIGWELDGVAQTPHTWTGSLTNDMVSSLVTVGSATYTEGNHNIRFYAHSPNDSTDKNTSNDTLEMSFYACSSILNGVYTLGGTSADFANFTELSDVLNNCGINGTTTIKVNPGVYNETITFPGDINGLDSLTKLTIVSATNNKNDVIISNINGGDHVIAFDSAAWISIKNITIKGESSNTTSTIDINNYSNNIVIEGCNIIAPYANIYSNKGLNVVGSTIRNITVKNNKFEGGYNAISFVGSYLAASYQRNTKIIGNTVSGFYSRGIEMKYQKNLVVSNNTVTRFLDVQNTKTLSGIYVYNATGPIVESNSIIVSPKNSAYGVYMSGVSGLTASNALVTNNMISVKGGVSSSTIYGMYLTSVSNIGIYYNSVSVSTGSSSSSYAYYMSSTSSTNVTVNNNVFANTAGGPAFARMSGTFNSLDYNAYYATGLVIMKWGYSVTTPTSSGITGIRNLSSADTNSLVANPLFYSVDNLHSYGSALDGAAKVISFISTDIDGDTRHASTPDIGADEFSVSSTDAGILKAISPLAVDTQNNVVPFKVLLKNYGSSALTSVSIKYSFNGSSLATKSWTGNLATGQSDTVLLNSFTVPAGDYELLAYTVLSGDTLNFNDTLRTTVNGLPLIEVGLVELVSPADGCGKGSAEDIQIEIKNNGVGYINNGLTASFQVNGGTMYTENITDTIGPGGSLIFTFNQQADLSTGFQDSTYNILVAVSHSSDLNGINDTALYSVVSFANLLPPLVSDTTINYGDTVVLTAYSNYPVVWYDNDTSNVSIGSGSYTTPNLFDTTTYYAQANIYNPPATGIIGNGSTTVGFFDANPYGVNMGSGKSQILYTAAELKAIGVTAGNLESIAFKAASQFNGPSVSFEIKLANVPNSSLTGTFLTPTMTSVYTFNGPMTVTAGWNVHQFSTPFYWDGTSNLLVTICTAGNPYNAGAVYYTTTAASYYTATNGMGAGCNSTTGATTAKRPNIQIVKQGTFGCYSAKVPLVVNVPLPAIDARVSEIVSPVSNCGLASTSVTIDIENMGTDTIVGPFTAKYKINNGSYITPETINDTILPDDTLRYTFNTSASLLPGTSGTNYVITAKVSVTSDSYSPNDSLISDSIFSKYTPTNPVVSNIVINYGDSAVLNASATDTVYWYADSMGTQLVGVGSTFHTNPIYDTTQFYAMSRKTVVQADYLIGTGTTATGSAGPSPYGAGSYKGFGMRTQFLITASELKALGMIQGPINSVSFDVASVVGVPLNNYTIRIGHTSKTDMSGQYFEGNLTTVYTTAAYIEHVYWNEHVFSTPFVWDGSSNIIIETCFKNNAYVNYTSVRYTPTQSPMVAYNYAKSSFNCADSIANYNSLKRANIKLNQEGLDFCTSDLMGMQVAVINYAANDAALTAFTEPINSASSITASPVKVVLRNYGLNNLTSATINWSENGTAQTPFVWTGNLAKGSVDTVTIASNHLFAGGSTEIKAWVNMLNDTMHSNDTIVSNITVCMSGAYSINPVTGDYHSFTEAVNDLDISGICGAVVFNVDSGLYSEQITLHAIQGSSATNTITFQSTALDSTKVLLTHSTMVNNNYIFKIAGASYVTIKNLGLKSNGSTAGNVIVLTNKAHHIDIVNNYLTSTNSIAYSTIASAVYSYREGVDHVLIDNNYIQNGYKAVVFEGISTDSINDCVVSNNTFIDYTRSAAEFRYTNNAKFNNNMVTSSPNNSQVYGVYAYKNKDGFELTNNTMLLSSTSTIYGVYMSYMDGTASNKIKVNNNFISVLTGTSSSRGLYFYNLNNSEVVYNSINMHGGGSGSSAVYISLGSNHTFKNNNLISRNGYALYASSIPSGVVFDYNNYYVDTTLSSKFVRWVSEHTDLASLKTFDVNNNVHSVSFDPLFFSTTNLHSQQISIYNAATPIAGVTLDIDGDTRSTTTPSIGADEFVPSAIDLGLVNLAHPTESSCGYLSNDSIVVQVKNFGLNNINFATQNATVEVIVSGIVTDTITYVINTGSLSTGNTMRVKVSNNFNLSFNGLYTFNASITIASDGNSANDDITPVDIVSYPNINSFPFVESFESGTNISLKETSSTESKVSVSTVAANNGSYGLHFEGRSYTSWSNASTVTAAFANTAHVSEATTCNVDASSLTALMLQFDLRQTKYSSYSAKTSWFRVMLTDASGNTYYLKNAVGDSVFLPTTPSSDPFVRQVFNLTPYVGQNLKISFQAANKYSYGYGSYDGDNVFIDDINLWQPAPIDIAMSNIILDYYHGKAGDSTDVTVSFTNMGTDTLYSIPLAYQIDNGSIVYDTAVGVFYPTATDTFTFANKYSYTDGLHNMCVFVNHPNDAVNANDTVCTSIKGMLTYVINYSDNFDSKNDWFAHGSQNQWVQGTPNKTNLTGAHSGQNAWVTNLTSDYSAGTVEYLYSPYFVISPYASSAQLDFYLFVDVVGSFALGELEYSFDGVNWSAYGYIGMPNSVNWYNKQVNGKHGWAMQNSGWNYTSTMLDSATFNNGNKFQLRFVFESTLNNTTAEGMAIDDFKITIPAFATDAGVSNIINPTNSTAAGDSVMVSVEVRNFGIDTLTSIPVSYAIDGTVMATETWSGQLLQDSVEVFTFATKYMSGGVDYKICAYTGLSNDMQVHNDTSCANITTTAAQYDAGITSILAPVGQSSIGQPTTVKVTIRNFGLNTLTSVPVEYFINGTSMANEVYNGSINPGDSVDYTFTTTYVSSGGTYILCATTNLTTDGDNTNDKICTSVVGTSLENAKGDVFMVAQNQPNPAKNTTSIEFYIPKSGMVQFKVVNMLGAVVEEQEKNYTSGSQKIVLNTENLQAGVYHYSLSFDGQVKTFKMIVVR